MEPEINAEEVVVEEPTNDINTEGLAQIEGALADAKAQYESGEIEWDAMLDELQATIDSLRTDQEVDDMESPLGGLGGGGFDLPEPEEN